MSIVANQQRTFLALAAQLRPHWHRDRNLPARIQTLLASNRAFGSRDRRLYRELLYTTLRYLPWLEPSLDRDPDLAARLVAWLAADSRATEKYRAVLVADWPPCPSSVAEKASILADRAGHKLPVPLPDWFRDHCPAAFESPEIDALLSRAPLWLRLQTPALEQVAREFQQLGWQFEVSALLPSAIRLLDEVDVTKTVSFQAGLVEVQDLGSQLLLESAAVAPGESWLDACAGAGGKTLQLARLLGPAGSIDAHDVRRAALDELAARAGRAHIQNIRVLRAPLAASASYDGVLVDAPCSGSGTWRRAPHLKWTTTPQHVAAAVAQQRELLAKFSQHVRVGGRLLYATCSLSRAENEDVVASFLETHEHFAVEPPRRTFGASASSLGLAILPGLHNTDGFFVSAFRRVR